MSRRRRLIGGGLGVGSGLQLWLDASDLSTIVSSSGSVSQWTDKSGNSNHATQGTGPAKPTTGSDAINGLNVITFNGTSQAFVLPSALHSIANGPNTIFAVSTSSVDDAQQRVITGRESGSTRYSVEYTSTTEQMAFRSGTSPGGGATIAGVTKASPNIIRGRRSGTTQAISVNGSAEQTNTNGADESGVDDLYIASASGSTLFLTGTIAEIILYNRSLSTAEMALVEQYLSNKWGITLS